MYCIRTEEGWLYVFDTGNGPGVVRDLGLAQLNCAICEWPLLLECPRCVIAIDEIVCPILYFDSWQCYHAHCADPQWTPIVVSMCECESCQRAE